ncbi:chaperone modulator CbpM [Citrobacter sp. JGM124]|uniref:chaperone modulator CbpM n=1 Tax=Citrobacter sp. JGM124 TaxID=2799789 RepID=UPI001BA97A52|nr:chaperone modulator CbpM [Citrobacter sp. JGM124]MBS0849424.1 chaperone-modulator protein CbpM [Citrobacter sp. JGM124]
MTEITVTTHNVSEFCFCTGVSEEDLLEIVGLGVIEPQLTSTRHWIFVDNDVVIVHRAVRLRRELALDWPGIAIVLTLLDDNNSLRSEKHRLEQRLAKFILNDLN